MAYFHVGMKQELVVIGFEFAEFGDPLGGLPVLHLAVVQAGGDEHVGIVFGFHLIVGAVAQDVVVVILFVGVAPLIVLAGGEGDGVVEHGGHYVDEGNLGYYARPEVRAHVGDCAHQEAARTAAHGEEVFLGGVVVGQEPLSGVDEVGEGVLFVEEFTVFVPRAAHLLSAPDMGDHEDEAPV